MDDRWMLAFHPIPGIHRDHRTVDVVLTVMPLFPHPPDGARRAEAPRPAWICRRGFVLLSKRKG